MQQQQLFCTFRQRHEFDVIHGMYSRGVESSKMWVAEVDGNIHYLRIKADEMAKRKGNGVGRQSDQSFKGYANCSLTAERKRLYEEWDCDFEKVLDMLSDVVLADYRVGLSVMNNGATVQVALTCRAKGHADAGYCMTSRAPTWHDALRVAMWKHFIVAEENWEPFKGGDEGQEWG